MVGIIPFRSIFIVSKLVFENERDRVWLRVPFGVVSADHDFVRAGVVKVFAEGIQLLPTALDGELLEGENPARGVYLHLLLEFQFLLLLEKPLLFGVESPQLRLVGVLRYRAVDEHAGEPVDLALVGLDVLGVLGFGKLHAPVGNVFLRHGEEFVQEVIVGADDAVVGLDEGALQRLLRDSLEMDAALLSSLGVVQALPHDLGIVLAVVPRPSAKTPSAEPTFEGGRKGIFSGESDPCFIKGGLPSVGKSLTPFVGLLPLFLAHDGWMVVGDVILVGLPVVL